MDPSKRNFSAPVAGPAGRPVTVPRCVQAARSRGETPAARRPPHNRSHAARSPPPSRLRAARSSAAAARVRTGGPRHATRRRRAPQASEAAAGGRAARQPELRRGQPRLAGRAALAIRGGRAALPARPAEHGRGGCRLRRAVRRAATAHRDRRHGQPAAGRLHPVRAARLPCPTPFSLARSLSLSLSRAPLTTVARCDTYRAQLVETHGGRTVAVGKSASIPKKSGTGDEMMTLVRAQPPTAL